MWVAHLQGIALFSKEVVEKLALFGTNGSPMMGEVLKAAASRKKISDETAVAVRIKVSVQGWGEPITMNLAGENLEGLIGVGRGVGAELIVEEVIQMQSWSMPFIGVDVDKILKTIVSHLDQKERSVHTEWNQLFLGNFTADDSFPLFSLFKLSKSWKLGMLTALFASSLAPFPTDVVAAGQIGFLVLLELTSAVDNLDALKRFWEVSASLNIHHGVEDTTVGGGKGENPDADWQQVLDILMASEDEDEDEDRDEGEDEVEDGNKNND